MSCYIVNASTGLSRLPVKRVHFEILGKFMMGLSKQKQVVWCGGACVLMQTLTW